MNDGGNQTVSSELKEKLLKALERSEQKIFIEQNNHQDSLDLNDIKKLIDDIIIEAEKLSSLFWSNEELAELKNAVDFLEYRIQGMMRATLHNLHWYENEG